MILFLSQLHPICQLISIFLLKALQEDVRGWQERGRGSPVLTGSIQTGAGRFWTSLLRSYSHNWEPYKAIWLGQFWSQFMPVAPKEVDLLSAPQAPENLQTHV